MWPDNETARDFLNFSGVAETVAEIIVQARGRPISIGVSGAWGIGKSSMIKLTQASLAGRARSDGERDFVFVEFNAWLYQGYDDARAALMDVIAYKLEEVAKGRASAGGAAKAEILKRKLDPAPRAWDLLSIALSIIAADVAGHRSESPDGWTRDFELDIAVAEPAFWNTVAEDLGRALAFLTTDRWALRFHDGGMRPTPPKVATRPLEDCAVLLSGGLDSLIGAIDLAAKGKRPFAVSQIVRGDAEKQVNFAGLIGGGLSHVQLNHNADVPGVKEDSQRARSLIFMAFGVLIATSLRSYGDGHRVPLYVCENGFIAMNPALTGARLGSLSTRTAHPEFLARLQAVLDAAGLRVQIETPYRTMTKGEMLAACADQTVLRAEAARSTSCGRFQRFNYKHCGRCVPCQVRRAAFLAWGRADSTGYVFETLGTDDPNFAGFDDVRAVRMAIAEVQADGLEAWLGPALSSGLIPDKGALKGMIERGLEELAALHDVHGVK